MPQWQRPRLPRGALESALGARRDARHGAASPHDWHLFTDGAPSMRGRFLRVKRGSGALAPGLACLGRQPVPNRGCPRCLGAS